MQRILVATDLSSRSDGALRRATMFAKPLPATFVTVNVVDDNQPARLADTAQRETTAARQCQADLVAIGTRAQGVLTKLFLGSVAEDVLRSAEYDVLAVPPARS